MGVHERTDARIGRGGAGARAGAAAAPIGAGLEVAHNVGRTQRQLAE